MVKIFRMITLTSMSMIITSCGSNLWSYDKPDKSRGFSLIDTPQEELTAGIWFDPNGCQHWMIDDGIEGYLSQRLKRNGKPYCDQESQKNVVTGPYNQGLPDLI